MSFYEAEHASRRHPLVVTQEDQGRQTCDRRMDPPRSVMCHPEPAGGARTAHCSRVTLPRRRRTAKDLKIRGAWHVRRNLRSLAFDPSRNGMCHPEPAGGARAAQCSRASLARRRRTAKDLKMRGTWPVRRSLRSFAVLRRNAFRQFERREGVRLRLSQDDTSIESLVILRVAGARAVVMTGCVSALCGAQGKS
jgi:hypothetical protein